MGNVLLLMVIRNKQISIRRRKVTSDQKYRQTGESQYVIDNGRTKRHTVTYVPGTEVKCITSTAISAAILLTLVTATKYISPNNQLLIHVIFPH